LDIAIICNSDVLFYTYAFPMKAFEIVACNVPLIISKIGPLIKYYNKYPNCFFKVNDVDSFCKAIQYQLKNQVVFDVKINTWETLSKKINSYLKLTFSNQQ
jgi:glycosyltransferase involved in cell wall biosynthesis